MKNLKYCFIFFIRSYKSIIYIPVLLIIPLIIFITLFISYKTFKDRKSEYKIKKRKRCPICGTELLANERIFTEAYPENNEKRIVFLYGCPHCNNKKTSINKICPVCKRIIPKDSYLIGKMWNDSGKNRVHITGCNLCKSRS